MTAYTFLDTALEGSSRALMATFSQALRVPKITRQMRKPSSKISSVV